jgi:hypothetical protein
VDIGNEDMCRHEGLGRVGLDFLFVGWGGLVRGLHIQRYHRTGNTCKQRGNRELSMTFYGHT